MKSNKSSTIEYDLRSLNPSQFVVVVLSHAIFQYYSHILFRFTRRMTSEIGFFLCMIFFRAWVERLMYISNTQFNSKDQEQWENLLYIQCFFFSMDQLVLFNLLFIWCIKLLLYTCIVFGAIKYIQHNLRSLQMNIFLFSFEFFSLIFI